MKLRILIPIASAARGFRVGEVVDLSDCPAGADAWADVPLEDGTYRAVWVRDAIVESAVAAPVEVAATRATRRRG